MLRVAFGRLGPGPKLFFLGLVACVVGAAPPDSVRDNIEDRREVAAVLTHALLEQPGDVDLWIRLARLQDRRGFQQEARDAYAQALVLAPDRSDLWDELAAHRARVRVSVGRSSTRGWVKVLLRLGHDSAQGELAFEVSDPGTKLEQLLSLDIPPLAPGRYQLEVEIEDLVGGRFAKRVAPFTALSAGEIR